MDRDRYLAVDFDQLPIRSPGFIWASKTHMLAVDKTLAWGALGLATYAVVARPQLVKEALRVTIKLVQEKPHVAAAGLAAVAVLGFALATAVKDNGMLPQKAQHW